MTITPEQLQRLFLILPVVLLSVAIHEFAHCWITDRLGDDTPRQQGRVTLNPLVHLDPMGTIMMVLSSLAGFGIGWGKPSPMNPNNFRHPARDRMISALAGPLSNIIQMLAWGSLGALILTFATPAFAETRAYVTLGDLVDFGIFVNASLAVFNLIPVYPLDGHHVLSYLAPRAWRPIIDHQGWMIVFLAIVMVPPLRNHILWPVMNPAIGILLTGVNLLVG